VDLGSGPIAMAGSHRMRPGEMRQYPADDELEGVIGELLQSCSLARTTVGQIRMSLERRFGLAPGELRGRMDRVKELVAAHVARSVAEAADRHCSLRRWRELRARARLQSTPSCDLTETNPRLLGDASNRARGSVGRSIRAKAKPKARGSLGRALQDMEAQDLELLRDAAFGQVRSERGLQLHPYAGRRAASRSRSRGSYPVPRSLPLREDA